MSAAGRIDIASHAEPEKVFGLDAVVAVPICLFTALVLAGAFGMPAVPVSGSTVRSFRVAVTMTGMPMTMAVRPDLGVEAGSAFRNRWLKLFGPGRGSSCCHGGQAKRQRK
jgi:hypothetical protein